MSDGHIVYQGRADESYNYFQSNLVGKIEIKTSKFANPADTFMKILSINYPKQ